MEENAIQFIIIQKFQQHNSNNNISHENTFKIRLKEYITNGAAGNKFIVQLARARFHI